MTRTKIICTIGPSVESVEKMVQLIHAGMTAARLNFSHGTHAEHLKAINSLKEARNQTNKPLAIILDTKGPEIRLGVVDAGFSELKTGQRWFLTKETVIGNSEQVSITPPEILPHLEVGKVVLIDNGYISAHVVETSPDGVWIQIDNGGPISSRKGVNIPNSKVPLPAFTEKDAADIRFGCENGIDMIAASFVRSADHLLQIKKLLIEIGYSHVLVFAKIENREGVENFSSIIQAADGVMIARGDLGVEVPIYEVPTLQKMMIRESYLLGKPSVTATQMLESMMLNPRPTRAEVSDVANAIYDSTSSVMLSGETAVGKYPLAVVSMMRSIVEQSESDFNYRAFFEQHAGATYHDVPSSLTLATVKTAYSSNAKAIFCFTATGSTARLLSRLRPSMPIVAVTDDPRIYYQLSLYWGVVPCLAASCKNLTDAKKIATEYALKQNIVSYGDLVVLTAGFPFGIPGNTNTMIVENIGDVLVRGERGIGNKAHGPVVTVITPESHLPANVSGQILVLTKCDATYEALIRSSLGVILQNQIGDEASEKSLTEIAHPLQIPVLFRADGATHTLKDGMEVTIDPARGLVFKGVV